jgi:hypothetical protein
MSGVLFPDVELWATGYLRTELAGRAESYAASVYVSNAKPAANRPRTVVVRRDGGPQQGTLDFPRLTVRVWADKEKEASDLARLVHALLMDARGDGPVVSVSSISGPLGVADDSQPQKYLSVELRTRGSNL